MAMTRKHYQQTADNIGDVYREYSAADSPDPLFPLALKALAGRMAVMFALDNPRFDREKFMEACNLNKPTE